MTRKLTKAQVRELRDMAGRAYRSHYANHYPPILRLFDLGFVDRQVERRGSTTYAITPAGRAALTNGGGND